MMAVSAKSSPARRSIRDGPRREQAHDRGFHRSCDVVPVAVRPSFVTSLRSVSMLGEQQQHQHAQLPDRGEHALLLLARRKDRVLRRWPIAPSTDGPSSSPASSGPITVGYPIRRGEPPRNCPTRTISARRVMSSNVFGIMSSRRPPSRAARAGRQKEAETGHQNAAAEGP